ncbi:MAG: NADH-quinone oxidoreductase subunit N [Chloroflexi bacterium]|nr:NADH-quinone oxidoreductase subunit N [Chloroflexota bacterium]
MDWALLLPGFLATGVAVHALALDLLLPRNRKRILAFTAAAGLLLVALLTYVNYQGRTASFGGGLVLFDAYSLFFFLLFLVFGAVALVGSADYTRRLSHPGEFFALLTLSVVGAMGMAAAGELLTAYISLELLSFSLYVLASYAQDDPRSHEAGTKYILLGALSSALLLLGISYIYGLTGATRYADIARELATLETSPGLILAVALITAGLAFKVSAVPFHMWTPDVYEGAPLPVTAYLAAVSKVAGFALLLRLVAGALLPLMPFWEWAFVALAALSMVLGNAVAILQGNIKRLMAYSSIGQAGYMLMGVAALGHLAVAGVLFHMVGYMATTFAAFLAIIAFNNATRREEVRDFAGLAERSPFLALMLTAALFSLAGLPFFVGFATKFYLFTAVAAMGGRFLWLVGLAILASLVSFYYYLLVIRQMYIEKPAAEASRISVPPSLWAVLAVLLVAMVGLGVYPGPVAEAAEGAARALLP